MGTTSDLMSKEQKKAAEVIVEQKAGKKMEEQKSGELADLELKLKYRILLILIYRLIRISILTNIEYVYISV